MSVIVRDDGFHDDDWAGALAELAPDAASVEMAAALAEAEAIRIRFASFADGRGFTLARQMRALGFAGRLRASGPLLPDQYAMARRAGFDEVEISAAAALRLPQAHWLARANWRENDYQRRLRG